MSIDFTAETAFMLQDSGVPATAPGYSTNGIFEKNDQALLAGSGGQHHGEVYGAEISLVIKTGALGTLVNGPSATQITIAAVTYKVRDFVRIDDGELTKIMLET